jgi:dynein light chain LC8-type
MADEAPAEAPAAEAPAPEAAPAEAAPAEAPPAEAAPAEAAPAPAPEPAPAALPVKLKSWVKSCDMPDALKADAIALGKEAVGAHEQEKDIAFAIKKAFDDKHGATWHCIVGAKFGSYVTYEVGFIYFYVGEKAILLFKAG